MSLISPPFTADGRRPLPERYGDCPCACHRIPGIVHVMACCRLDLMTDNEIRAALKKLPKLRPMVDPVEITFVQFDDHPGPACKA